MAAVRRPACASCSSLLAYLLFVTMAVFTLAAGVAKGAGEPDPKPARVGDTAACVIECATKLSSYIMETIKCYVACMGGGGGGGGGFTLAAAKGTGELDPDRERIGGPGDCSLECATKLTGYIMETIKCYFTCAEEEKEGIGAECR